MKGEITVKFGQTILGRGDIELTGFNLAEVEKRCKSLRIEPTYNEGFRDGVLHTLDWIANVCKEIRNEIANSN